MIDADMSVTAKSELYNIIETCNLVKTTADFKAIFEKINHLLGQEMAAYGMGDVHTMAVISNLNVGFSKDFMATIVNASGQMTSPLFQRWLSCQSPQVLDFSNKKNSPPVNDLTLYRDFPLQNVISHGVMDYSQRYVSYFGIANISEKIGAYHTKLISMLAPCLHEAYSRLIRIKPLRFPSSKTLGTSESPCLLSERELDVLHWLSEGKSNWEIARILTISEHTVKNHTKRILVKLKATNRPHAITIAFGMGLLQLPF